MKKYLIGSVAIVVALAASSFTVLSKNAGDVFGNSGSSYSRLTSAYNEMNCEPQENPCAFQITQSGASHIPNSKTSLSPSEVSLYLSNGWISQVGTKKGLYQP